MTGGTLRLGIPITDEFSISPHYSIYNTRISIPNKAVRALQRLLRTRSTARRRASARSTCRATCPLTINCLTNGEASLAIKQAQGSTLTNLVGFNFTYNTLDNPKNPTARLFFELRNDVGSTTASARSGGHSNIFVRNTGDLRYYHPIYDDIVGIVQLQGGNVTAVGRRPAAHHRSVPARTDAGARLRARRVSVRATSATSATTSSTRWAARTTAGASVEVQFPIYGLPRDIGLKGAVFADAGTLFGYTGKTNFTPGGGACVHRPARRCADLSHAGHLRDAARRGCDPVVGRRQPDLGVAARSDPLRLRLCPDQGSYDVTQAFRFSGGTPF